MLRNSSTMSERYQELVKAKCKIIMKNMSLNLYSWVALAYYLCFERIGTLFILTRRIYAVMFLVFMHLKNKKQFIRELLVLKCASFHVELRNF